MISALLYAILLLCFFLPFINIFCDEINSISFIGYQLFIGFTINQQKVGRNLLFFLIFFIICNGMSLSLFMKSPKNSLVACITTLIALILLYSFKVNLDKDLHRVGEGIFFHVNYSVGFWYLALFLLITGAWEAFLLLKDKKELPPIDFYIIFSFLCFVFCAIFVLGFLFFDYREIGTCF